jgi:translocation and assembly module TamB
MNPPEGTPPPRRRLPRARHVSLGAVVLFVSLIAGGVAFLLSEAGLPFVIARVIGESGGRLTVEGASGSLASTMRFARLAWNGPEATIAADDVVVEWSALALFSRRLALRGLGADHIALAVKPSTGATAPPANLALPLAVDIDHVTVTQLDWQAGPRSGKITGLEFGYDGDAQIHRIRGLRLFSDVGALTGEASLRATAPFPVDGTIAIVGDGPLDGAKLDAALSGTLPALVVDAKGTMHDASMVAHVALTPFAGGAFESANVALERVDLAAFHDGLPQTQLALALDARPRDGSVAGGFRATNALPGSLDLHRLPLTAAAGNYAYASDALSLTVLDIELEGGGRARGDGQVNLGARDAPSSWRLTVRDLDLARLHPALVRTRLTGSLAADVDGARQTIDGNLAEPSLAVAFAVTHAEGRLDVTRFRAEAPGGSLTGSGKIALDAPRAFDVTLAARRFDPARFVALPAGSLDGTIKATGVLLPEWKTEAEIALAPGSRLAGVALAGTVRGTATRRTLRAAAIDITAAGTRLTAHGDAGVAGDRLAFAFDAPRLADLAPLAPASLPHPLAGSIRATGTLALEPGGAGGDVDLKGDGVRIGAEFAAQTIALQASFAPGGSANAATPRNARPLTLSAAATRIVVRQISLASARADIRGTLASHKATLAARGDAIDAAAELAGGFDDLQSAAQWRGQLLALTNRGDVPLTLTSPAALELGPAHARLANAHIVTADGRADVGDLEWNNGRVTTRGTFEGVPLASLATIAGRPLPMASTLKLSGDWSIAAAPRLTGAFAIRRQSGDLFGATPDSATGVDVALGIDTLALSGTLHDDALDAQLAFRSARSGNAQGTLSLGAVAGAPPGRLAPDAPLAFTLDAELATLTPLQPWLGTAAVVNGSARIALSGHGTFAAPVFSGTVAGDALRIDAPQYGVYLRDGRVRAHIADGGIAVDEISIAGGAGRFTASGTIAARDGNAGTRRTEIAWHAEDFRVTNRPDLRLVVAGAGTLAVQERRLAIAGNVNVVEGKIEYDPAPPGQLGADVVVVGRTTRAEQRDSIADLPLTLNVDVDFGHNLTFEGSGLTTSLEGSVRVTTAPDGHLNGRGTITAAHGTYFAFGQKLTIDRGRLFFDGALDNPALDVVALRKNLAVEAGVEVTGTVKVPRVRITSNPPVPENEALAWLITGEGLGAGSRTDYAALSAASAALFSRGGKPITTEIAQTMGLDDITVRGGGIGGGGGSAAGTTGQVIVFGKRISDRLTLGYEQGLSIAANALRLEYSLSNTLTLRAEAGTVSGVGVYYRRTYD